MTDETLVLAAIDGSRETWLAAAAIASEAGLPLERVQAALDASPGRDLSRPRRPRSRVTPRARTTAPRPG